MPNKKKRVIGIEAVNEIRAAHGRLLRCLERSPSRYITAASYEDLDEAEYLLRRALAGIGVKVRGRKIGDHIEDCDVEPGFGHCSQTEKDEILDVFKFRRPDDG